MNTIELPPPVPDESESLRQYRKLLEKREAEAAKAARSLPDSLPLVLEIGCGHGHFLTSVAEKDPSRYYVGIDVAQGRIQRARRKTTLRDIPNLEFHLADARLFLSFLKPKQCSQIFVLFPDPFPKEKQKKHRLMQGEFLQTCHRILNTDGYLFFRTDVFDYFQEVLAWMEQNRDLFEPVSSEIWPAAETTVFENRAQKVHSQVFRRK
ncbi:MAG: tRNA (guanosine(46)-N7)-methyltransferase TrmB [Opitutales bacterium]|nr:tRNA (guanosine(46)-N7)-methyltransferase TrmB [Opitutales bacterium]MCH8540156.1 tRNA (guanosine(46)-N7)-methyltransferase TrmB [Opitutales bacterium]